MNKQVILLLATLILVSACTAPAEKPISTLEDLINKANATNEIQLVYTYYPDIGSAGSDYEFEYRYVKVNDIKKQSLLHETENGANHYKLYQSPDWNFECVGEADMTNCRRVLNVKENEFPHLLEYHKKQYEQKIYVEESTVNDLPCSKYEFIEREEPFHYESFTDGEFERRLGGNLTRLDEVCIHHETGIALEAKKIRKYDHSDGRQVVEIKKEATIQSLGVSANPDAFNFPLPFLITQVTQEMSSQELYLRAVGLQNVSVDIIVKDELDTEKQTNITVQEEVEQTHIINADLQGIQLQVCTQQACQVISS